MKEALSGKFPFAKEVLDRVDGKPEDRLRLEQSRDVRILVTDGRGNEREGGFEDIRAAMLGLPVSLDAQVTRRALAARTPPPAGGPDGTRP